MCILDFFAQSGSNKYITVFIQSIETPYLLIILVLNLKWSIVLPLDVSKILLYVCKSLIVPILRVIKVLK